MVRGPQGARTTGMGEGMGNRPPLDTLPLVFPTLSLKFSGPSHWLCQPEFFQGEQGSFSSNNRLGAIEICLLHGEGSRAWNPCPGLRGLLPDQRLQTAGHTSLYSAATAFSIHLNSLLRFRSQELSPDMVLRSCLGNTPLELGIGCPARTAAGLSPRGSLHALPRLPAGPCRHAHLRPQTLGHCWNIWACVCNFLAPTSHFPISPHLHPHTTDGTWCDSR